MTCIVAHRGGWMVADRRINSCGVLLNPYACNKITRVPGMLIASSGPAVLRDLIVDAVCGLGEVEAFNAAVRVVRSQPDGVDRGHALALDA